MTGWLSSRSTLFRQIVALLSVLMLAFVALESAMVVGLYATDADGLAQDIVDMQAARVLATPPDRRSSLRPPQGVRHWAFEVVTGRPPAAGPFGDGPGLLSWTRLDRIPGGVRISGVRSSGAGRRAIWARVELDMTRPSAYLPAIIKELGDHVAGPFAPLVLTLLIFTVLAVRRLLGPLEQAAREVDALTPGRPGQRLSEPASPSEVRALVLGFNRALGRTDAAMEQLKGFTAHVAHDLRTPLAILRLAIAEVQPAPLRAQLEEDLGAMTRLVGQLLELAKAGAITPGQGRHVRLGELAREVCARMTPLALDDDRKIVVVDRGGDQTINGRPDALATALRNLIENAIKHDGPGPIEVIVGEGPRLTVRDYGPGINEADAEHMFERFWRKGDADADGAGLGLEIVRAITQAHGGSVSAANAPGGGAQFTMDFTAASAAIQSPAAA